MAYKYVCGHVYAIVNETKNDSSWIRLSELMPASVFMVGKAEISDQLPLTQRASAVTRKTFGPRMTRHGGQAANKR
jgi:hypothetical protein